jgi:hypothetical protein
MGYPLILPTEDLVRAASAGFAEDVGERALKHLFAQFPCNNDRAHILLKVVTLNRIYSAGIFAVYDVADHIYRQEIDAELSSGVQEVVDRIARVTIHSSGKERRFWSFATKYCSWHNPDSYPIWDSRVCRYFKSLNRYLISVNQAPFRDPEMWTRYREFRNLVDEFRIRYKLDLLSYKEVDMFLWKYGAKSNLE